MPRRTSSADARPGRRLRELGLSPSRRRGQNFLHDGNVTRKIARLALEMAPPYLEIGPGLGALTAELSASGERITAVEVDRGLAASLRERFAGTTVEILEADVLSVPDAEWERRFPSGATVVGNLPYALSSPILLWLIDRRRRFPRAVFMLQKEVVERLCAPAGSRDYGILSVYLQALGDVRPEFPVRRSCFTPAPRVDSAVVSIAFRGEVDDRLFLPLRTVVRAAFAQRRKMLRNAPVPFLPGGPAQWCALLSSEGIDPGGRAEDVDPARWLSLAGRLGGRPGATDTC